MLATAFLPAPSPWPPFDDEADPADEHEPPSPAGRTAHQRFLVRDRKRLLVIDPESVDWIESAGNYVRLHVGTAAYLIRLHIGQVGKRLDARVFERIHRRTIVNMRKVVALAPAFNGDYFVFLSDGTELKLSRTYRKAVFARQFLNGLPDQYDGG